LLPDFWVGTLTASPYSFDRKIDISFSTPEIIFHGGHPVIIVALNLRACQTQLKNSRAVSR
jgi:hypothetical protein